MKHRTLLTLATECRLDTRRAKLMEQKRKHFHIDHGLEEILELVVAIKYKQQRGEGI
jgi:hypothetical protein